MPSVVAPRLLLTTAVAVPPPVETVGVADRLDACVVIVGVVRTVEGDADPPTESAVVVGVPIPGVLDVPIVETVDVPVVEEGELPSADDVPDVDEPLVGADPPVVGANPVLPMPSFAANASKSDAIPAMPSFAANAAKSASDAGALTVGGVTLALGAVGDVLVLGPVGVVGPLKPNGVVADCDCAWATHGDAISAINAIQSMILFIPPPCSRRRISTVRSTRQRARGSARRWVIDAARRGR